MVLFSATKLKEKLTHISSNISKHKKRVLIVACHIQPQTNVSRPVVLQDWKTRYADRQVYANAVDTLEVSSEVFSDTSQRPHLSHFLRVARSHDGHLRLVDTIHLWVKSCDGGVRQSHTLFQIDWTLEFVHVRTSVLRCWNIEFI